MKVCIVGPGAMGCLLAARFAHAGIATTLIDHRQDRAARLNQSGITVSSSGKSVQASPACSVTIPPKQSLVIVCTKSGATSTLKLPSGTPVLTLQNGLGNVETLCEKINSKFVLVGATFESAHKTSENAVEHVSAGPTRFGAWTDCPADPVAEAFRVAGFDCEITEAPGQALWERVCIAAGAEPLSALLRVPNGALVESLHARQLLRDLVVEAAKVAAVEGYRFEYSLVERAEQFCRDSAGVRSSMLADVDAGKATEIEEISGEIIHRAERAGLPVPRTRVLWQLVTSLPIR